jgi:hypothetical protein
MQQICTDTWFGYPRCLFCGYPADGILELRHVYSELVWHDDKPQISGAARVAGAPVWRAGQVRLHCSRCDIEWPSPYRGCVSEIQVQTDPIWPQYGYAVAFRFDEDADYGQQLELRLQGAANPWEAVVSAYMALPDGGVPRATAIQRLCNKQYRPEVYVRELAGPQRCYSWGNIDTPVDHVDKAREALKDLQSWYIKLTELVEAGVLLDSPIVNAQAVVELEDQLRRAETTLEDCERHLAEETGACWGRPQRAIRI